MLHTLCRLGQNIRHREPILVFRWEPSPSQEVQRPGVCKTSEIGYNVLAHLKKIHALVSVYDNLQMSRELRESLIDTLLDPQKY